MKWLYLSVVVVLAILQYGCVSFTMDDYDQRRDVERPNYTQIAVVSVSGVEPLIYEWGAAEHPGYHSGLYKIKLCATGDFIVHDGFRTESLNVGRRTLTFGFWPGAALDANSSAGAGMIVFMSPLMNFSLVCIPTLSSLLCEPFRDYSLPPWATGTPENCFTDFSLFGFRKHYKGGNTTPLRAGFRETGRHKSARADLYGYTLLINGRRFKSESDGTVSLYGFTRGQRLRISVAEAPSVRADSPDKLQELEGVEFNVVVP